MFIYLSYPMSGGVNWSLSRGEELAGHLRDKYPEHHIIAPHEIMLSEDGKSHLNPGLSHGGYVRADIDKGLRHADAIALAEGWTRSTGCLLEFQFAALLDLKKFLVQEEDGQREFGLVEFW